MKSRDDDIVCRESRPSAFTDDIRLSRACRIEVRTRSDTGLDQALNAE
jgi:hypothetical protein